MAKDHISQGELGLIKHEINETPISQRASDGYVNATALSQASGKLLGNYFRNKTTEEFLEELSSDMRIPISGLVEIVKGGRPSKQGTWVHPQVAINLGQWLSPKFAVKVSNWVFEWMSGGIKVKLPYHIRRYLKNRHKIPHRYFSMLDQMTVKLLADLEAKGYELPAKMVPDISMGLIFSKFCRDKGYDPKTFPTYEHEYEDGRKVQARLYPNELLSDFNIELEKWVRDRSLKYFKTRDPKAIPFLKEIYAELPGTQTKLKLEKSKKRIRKKKR